VSRFTIKVNPDPEDSCISELRVYDRGILTARAAINHRGGASFALVTDIPVAGRCPFSICEQGEDALFSIATMLGYDVLGPEFAEALALQGERQKRFRETLA